MSDSDYNNKEGYLNRQIEFAEADLVDGKVIPFTNGLDKGCPAKMAAWEHGKKWLFSHLTLRVIGDLLGDNNPC